MKSKVSSRRERPPSFLAMPSRVRVVRETAWVTVRVLSAILSILLLITMFSVQLYHLTLDPFAPPWVLSYWSRAALPPPLPALDLACLRLLPGLLIQVPSLPSPTLLSAATVPSAN